MIFWTLLKISFRPDRDVLRSALNSARQSNSEAFQVARKSVADYQKVGRRQKMNSPAYLAAESDMIAKRRQHRVVVEDMKNIEA